MDFRHKNFVLQVGFVRGPWLRLLQWACDISATGKLLEACSGGLQILFLWS